MATIGTGVTTRYQNTPTGLLTNRITKKKNVAKCGTVKRMTFLEGHLESGMISSAIESMALSASAYPREQARKKCIVPLNCFEYSLSEKKTSKAKVTAKVS